MVLSFYHNSSTFYGFAFLTQHLYILWFCLVSFTRHWIKEQAVQKSFRPSKIIFTVVCTWAAPHRSENTLSRHFHWCYSIIHLAVCLTTGPEPLPKRALHVVRSRASSFKWEYPHLSVRSSSSFLRLLPCLPVTSIPHFIFSSITRCRRQFLRKMWPIQFAFRLRISCRIFLCSLTLSKTSSFLTWSVQLIVSILLQHHISKLSRCFWSTARSVQAPVIFTGSSTPLQ